MGVATISHDGKVFTFRTDPNSIKWTYSLNTKVENTYGGRVVQLLSVNLGELEVTADSGSGGWEYTSYVARFFRDMLVDQRGGGRPGVFSYPTRGWELGIYALNFPFSDSLTDVRGEMRLRFKVQEDISGVISSDTLRSEIARLSVGVGWKRSEYNDPEMSEGYEQNKMGSRGSGDQGDDDSDDDDED